MDENAPKKIGRRSLLASTATLAGTSLLGQVGAVNTASAESAQGAGLTGTPIAPLSAGQIRQFRTQFLAQKGYSGHALLEESIVEDDEQVIGYGIRLHNGVPEEHFSTVAGNVPMRADLPSVARAHDRIQQFINGGRK